MYIFGGQERERGKDWSDDRGVRAMASGNVDDDPWAELVVTRDDGGGTDPCDNPRVIVHDDARTNCAEIAQLETCEWGKHRYAALAEIPASLRATPLAQPMSSRATLELLGA